MLKLVDKRNGREVDTDQRSIDKLLKRARRDERRDDLHFHRKRVAYNLYVVEIWSDHPLDKPQQAKHLYDIVGANRVNITENPEPIKGKPTPKPDHKPKPPKQPGKK